MKHVVVFLLLLMCALCAMAQTQVALTASSPVSLAGTLVNFSATVSGTPSVALPTSTIPTGNVTFLDGTTPLAQVTLAQAGNGLPTANFSLANLSGGSHAVTAQYSGDANFKAAVSPAVTVSVDAYSITPSATSLSLAQGQSGTITYTVADLENAGTSVQFACQPPPNTFTTCDFSPPALSGNGQAVLTIATTGAAAASAAAQGGRGLFAAGTGALGCLLVCWSPLGFRLRRWGSRAQFSALILALFLCGIAGSSGCGSSSSANASVASTPTGTQSFEVVTATTANGQTVGQNTWVTVQVVPAS